MKQAHHTDNILEQLLIEMIDIQQALYWVCDIYDKNNNIYRKTKQIT